MSSLQRDMIRRQLPAGLPPRPLPGGGGPLPRRGQKDYSPLSWQSYFDAIENIVLNDGSTFRVYLSGFDDSDYGCKPLLVLLHGGGYSALTWAIFVKHLTQLCYCKVAAIDLRGHGATVTTNDDDLSADTMASDVAQICASLLGNDNNTPIILVGHSMGGAIATHCAVKCHELVPSLTGLIVIDVVEGTALDALQGMQSILRGRPKEFPSLQNAIEWR